tara:strand:- start:1094 stop:1945 length:852 start_codon:yes stop_codon:yes gene_type:complete
MSKAYTCLSNCDIVEITDNHFHLDPSGRKELAVKDFIKAGGTRLVLVHKPYGPWKQIDSFKKQVSTTLKLADKARGVGAKVAVVAAPHPIELLKLVESSDNSKGTNIYLDAVDYCTSLVDENKTVGLGELGRPHFEVDESTWELSNNVLTESLSRAKDVAAAVVLHTESGTPEVMADLSRIADKANFPKSRLVKHYGGPAALENPSGLVVSLISSSTNIESSAASEFMLETDYLDDPERPGAVMGPKTVPRKTQKALESNVLSKDQVHRIHTELPNLVYREFL